MNRSNELKLKQVRFRACKTAGPGEWGGWGVGVGGTADKGSKPLDWITGVH